MKKLRILSGMKRMFVNDVQDDSDPNKPTEKSEPVVCAFKGEPCLPDCAACNIEKDNLVSCHRMKDYIGRVKE